MHFFNFSNQIKTNSLSFLIALFPLSFIAGNMIININIVLFILVSLLFFGIKIFKIEYLFIDKILLIFFSLILLTAFLNDNYFIKIDLYWKGQYATVIKSILFLKYLLMYIFLRYLIQNNILKLKFFFIFASLASIFVSIDIFYQFMFGKDIFGYETHGHTRKLGGPFGDEMIAGSFIQRFAIFAFFVLPIFYKKLSNKMLISIFILLLIIFLIGIILSGNRIPFILFLFLITLILVFQKELRKYLIFFFTILSLIFLIIYNFNTEVRINFQNFYKQIYGISKILTSKNIETNTPQYFKEFESFYNTWTLNKYLGGGIKNFRYYCHVRPHIDREAGFICNMHPHNYYLEILTETGLVGLFLILIIFSITIYKAFIKKYFFTHNYEDKLILAPFLFLFFVEIFPIKSTGSFFTTGNSTYLFLLMGILIGLIRQENSFENQK